MRDWPGLPDLTARRLQRLEEMVLQRVVMANPLTPQNVAAEWDKAEYKVEITGQVGSTAQYLAQRVENSADGGHQATSSFEGQLNFDEDVLRLWEVNGNTNIAVGTVVTARFRGRVEAASSLDPTTEDWEFDAGASGGSSPNVNQTTYVSQPPGTTVTQTGGNVVVVNIDGTLYAYGPNGRVCVLCGRSSCNCCEAACVATPNVDDLTWVNQGNATRRVNVGGSITIRDPSGSATLDTHHNVFTLPATPYRVDIELIGTFGNETGRPMFGVGWRQSGTGEIQIVGVESQGGTKETEISGPTGNFHQLSMFSRKLDNATTLNAEYRSHRTSQVPNKWRLEDDGTNRNVYYSMTGHPDDWILYHTIGRTDFLTADQGTIWVDASESQGVVVVICCLDSYNYLSTETVAYEYYTYATVIQGVYLNPTQPGNPGYLALEAEYEHITYAEVYDSSVQLPPTLLITSDTQPTLNKVATSDGPPLSPYISPTVTFNLVDTYHRIDYTRTSTTQQYTLTNRRVSDDSILATYTSPSIGAPGTSTTFTQTTGSSPYPSTLTVSYPNLIVNNTASGTVTRFSLEAEAGDVICMQLAVATYSPSTSEWGTNGVDSVSAAIDGQSNPLTTPDIWGGIVYRKVLVSGTHDFVVTLSGSDISVAVIKVISGIADADVDDFQGNIGNDTNPSDPSPIDPVFYPAVIQSVVVTQETGSTPDGTWGDGFTEETTLGTDSGGTDIRISTATKTIASGTADPEKTITNSQHWVIYSRAISPQ